MKSEEHRKLIARERARYSREIHDRAAQNLTAIGLNLQLCQSVISIKPEKAEKIIANCLELIDATARELKYSIFEPSALLNLGLIPYIKKFIEGYEPLCSLVISGKEKSFSPGLELLVWRIFSEIFNFTIVNQNKNPEIEVKFDFNKEPSLFLFKIPSRNFSKNIEKADYNKLTARFLNDSEEHKLKIIIEHNVDSTLIKLNF